MKDTIRVAVYLTATIPQALALQAMFEHWNRLSRMGASRRIAFYVDGDGNFHPDAQFVNLSTEKLPPLTDEMREAAVVAGKENGDRVFDYDPVAWMLRRREEEYQERVSESTPAKSCDEVEHLRETQRAHDQMAR
jgi:hypothetical protein